jgi:predicted  nucleic acid-binding Zn-ribbon protein
MPAGIARLVNNDLQAIGYQLVTISHLCPTLQSALTQQDKTYRNSQQTKKASHKSSQNELRGRLIQANNVIIDLTKQIQQSKDHIEHLEENFNCDLENKTQRLVEKVTNQTRRINEQQAQIEVYFQILGIMPAFHEANISLRHSRKS